MPARSRSSIAASTRSAPKCASAPSASWRGSPTWNRPIADSTRATAVASGPSTSRRSRVGLAGPCAPSRSLCASSRASRSPSDRTSSWTRKGFPAVRSNTRASRAVSGTRPSNPDTSAPQSCWSRGARITRSLSMVMPTSCPGPRRAISSRQRVARRRRLRTRTTSSVAGSAQWTSSRAMRIGLRRAQALRASARTTGAWRRQSSSAGTGAIEGKMPPRHAQASPASSATPSPPSAASSLSRASPRTPKARAPSNSEARP